MKTFNNSKVQPAILYEGIIIHCLLYYKLIMMGMRSSHVGWFEYENNTNILRIAIIIKNASSRQQAEAHNLYC